MASKLFSTTESANWEELLPSMYYVKSNVKLLKELTLALR